MNGDEDLGPIAGIKPSPAAAPPRRRGGGFASRLILAAIAVFALSFFLAPWLALQAVRSAAESHDSSALADLVDYNAVRAGLKAQIYAQTAPAGQATAPDLWHDPLAALRRALQPGPPQPDVDGYMTPTALDALVNGRAIGQVSRAKPWPKLRYWGFDRCRLAVADPADAKRETLLTFQRRGLYTWKLSQIRLPEK